jgi:hypothetical protein
MMGAEIYLAIKSLLSFSTELSAYIDVTMGGCSECYDFFSAVAIGST